MTSEELSQSIKKMKIHMAKGEKIEYWLNFIFLLIPIILIGYVTIETAIQNKEFSFFALILIGFAILFLRKKLVNTKLNPYKSNLTEQQFIEANQATAKLNKWIVLSNNKSYFTAIQTTGFQSEGIKITAILKNGKLYLNSMAKPSIWSFPFTFGMNKKNKSKLIRQYQSILKGNNVKEIVNNEIIQREQDFWNDSEWTFKNAIIRLVGYGLSIFFISISVWMISLGKIEAIFLGITILGYSGTYIYYDIKIILEKRKKRKARL